MVDKLAILLGSPSQSPQELQEERDAGWPVGLSAYCQLGLSPILSICNKA